MSRRCTVLFLRFCLSAFANSLAAISPRWTVVRVGPATSTATFSRSVQATTTDFALAFKLGRTVKCFAYPHLRF